MSEMNESMDVLTCNSSGRTPWKCIEWSVVKFPRDAEKQKLNYYKDIRGFICIRSQTERSLGQNRLDLTC